jgi:uncharacterized protein (DUF924 family)
MDLSPVLTFWFGQLDAEGLSDAAHSENWWRKDAAFDAQVREQFLALWQTLTHEASLAGGPARLDQPIGSELPERSLARVIVLDQFSRNMFRGQAQSFSSDPQALALAGGVCERGEDRVLRGHHRVFIYMPFMHSERLVDQDRCSELFAQFHDEAKGRLREELANNLAFAQRHRDVIARFGRFPHRNQVLGRSSSSEEQSFLSQPGSSF